MPGFPTLSTYRLSSKLFVRLPSRPEAADPGALSSGPRLLAELHQSVVRGREGQPRRSEKVSDLQCILRESWSCCLSIDVYSLIAHGRTSRFAELTRRIADPCTDVLGRNAFIDGKSMSDMWLGTSEERVPDVSHSWCRIPLQMKWCVAARTSQVYLRHAE